MTDKVVDASAVVALLFNELIRERIVARLRGVSLHAPSLLEFEVANACLKKMRASPGERQTLAEALSLLDALAIAIEKINLREAIALAAGTKLSFYDASYLWLARALDAELVTLDDKLARADKALRRASEQGSGHRPVLAEQDNGRSSSGCVCCAAPRPSGWLRE